MIVKENRKFRFVSDPVETQDMSLEEFFREISETFHAIQQTAPADTDTSVYR